MIPTTLAIGAIVFAALVMFFIGLGCHIRASERRAAKHRIEYNQARLRKIEGTKRPSGIDFATWAEELKEGHKCGPIN